MAVVFSALLWFAALGAGIMTGVYFTFSVFAMRSFAALGEEEGARAMQSINRVILKSFLPLFFLSSLAAAALVPLGVFRWGADDGAAFFAAAGGALYVLGMFVVTVAGNVPLNNRLDAADPRTAEGRGLWRDYLRRWTRLNHVRTLACLLAMLFFMLAIAARG